MMIRTVVQHIRVRYPLIPVVVLVLAVFGAGPAAAADDPVCGGPVRLRVPGAEHQISACLADLTTAGTVATGHSIAAEWAGLQPAGARNPTGIPGIQLDGYFPDTSTFNTDHGWNHDAQFVIRLPERWNGGLVVAGTPGNRRQYANDFTISDRVLARGYAYAATDKGNSGTTFYQDGIRPGDAIAEWNTRVTELTRAAKVVVAQRYGHRPVRTLAAGISNGGYLVRWQLENHPELFDGGLDWEGTLWTRRGPNLFDFLPAAMRNYPEYAATGSPQAHDAHPHARDGAPQRVLRCLQPLPRTNERIRVHQIPGDGENVFLLVDVDLGGPPDRPDRHQSPAASNNRPSSSPCSERVRPERRSPSLIGPTWIRTSCSTG